MKNIIAIDIGSKNVHVLEGHFQGGVIEAVKAISASTPPNSVVDGRIENIPSMKDFLKALILKNKISSKSAVLTVYSASIITRDIILPAVNPNELANAVRYEMEQYLPSASDSYVIEHTIVSRITEENINKYRIRAAAVPREMVKSYYDFLKALNLKPLVMDIQSNSASKLFLMTQGIEINGEALSPDSTVIFVDMGNKNTTINIISDGKLELSRAVSLGGRDIDQAISKQLGISVDKAEQHKIAKANLDPFLQVDSRQVSDPVRTVVDQWINEVQKIMQYYTSRGGGIKDGRVYIYGGSSNLKGLTEYMEQFLNIPVKKLTSIGKLQFDKKDGGPGLEYFINAAGVMLKI